MPLPLAAAAALALFKMAVTALAVYEAFDVVRDIYEGLDEYKKGVEKAKKELDEAIEKLKKEIDQKIDEKQEVTILLGAAAADPQGPMTRKATGRGADNQVISVAIEQKIPFRKVISLVCDKAEALPVLSLRRKKGVTISDLPKAKRKALEAILEKGLDTFTDADLDTFIVVRLKQLAASLMFEFIDNCIEWKSPLKCEVSFGPKPGFADHPVEGATKLQRLGKISPFYPAPHRQAGSISADLVITEYRKQRCDKNNIFAIVEIKFAGDRIEQKQFENYRDLLARAATVKTKAAPVRYMDKPVAFGGRLSLFRYPEDRADESAVKDERRKSGKRPGGKV